MSDEQPNKRLHDLLLSLFDSPDQLRMWVSYGPDGEALADEITWEGMSIAAAADSCLRNLRRRGYVDSDLFTRLARDFPRRRQDIMVVAAALSTAPSITVSGRPNPGSPPPGDPYVLSDGNVEYIALDPRDLEPVSMVAQSLDNQWVPQQMLGEMFARGLALADVQEQRLRAARSEYLRALVNAEQVVVNRAYMYNNPVVSSDYVAPGEARDAFKALLADGVIVPFLLDERSPVEPPKKFTTKQFDAWRAVCQEVRMKCTRLSWRDADNTPIIRARMTRRFHDFATTAVGQDFDIHALGVAPEHHSDFRKRLRELADSCSAVASTGEHVTRELLYKRFVTRDGTAAVDGYYDPTKPFSGQIKQLIDLSYNVNLPDALGRFALTPHDSLPRSALQEWKVAEKRKRLDLDELKALVQRRVFELIQTSLFIDSYGSLALADVHALRRTDEWAEYLASVRSLLAAPTSFGEAHAGASLVYDRFMELAHLMTRMARGPREPWTPVPELDVTISGAVISIQWAGPDRATFRVQGEPSFVYNPGEVPMTATLNIRDIQGSSAQSDLGTNIQFLNRRVEDARDTFEAFIGYLLSQTWLRRVPVEHEDLQATINLPEAA